MTDEKGISIGDIVWVMFDDQRFRARVTWIPGATGDMWYVETDEECIAVNPQCGKLLGFMKVNTENKEC